MVAPDDPADRPADPLPVDPLQTIRALAETVIPTDDTIGAADIAAENFVAHYLDFIAPDLAALLAAALDGAAATNTGVVYRSGLFSELDLPQRQIALRALGEHEQADLRDLADIGITLVVAAYWGEWSGQDADGQLTSRPVGWDLTGYRGPPGSNPEASRLRAR